uniref:Protein kinase domain-containing protein n=1 Tax=Globodera rostochiensis TaxID=31243 RepID=A0A914H2P1_GLORO
MSDTPKEAEKRLVEAHFLRQPYPTDIWDLGCILYDDLSVPLVGSERTGWLPNRRQRSDRCVIDRWTEGPVPLRMEL